MTEFSLTFEFLLVLIGLSVMLTWASSRRGCPLLAIFSRWVRWVVISVSAAALINYFGISSRPLWALALFSFLLWFLLETLYSWLAIDALSRSNLPMFPRFRENPRGNEWPATKRFIRLREAIRKAGLTNTESLVADIHGDIVMRSAVYETADRCTRVQILFLPHPAGEAQVSFVVTSLTEKGKRIITDNFFLPFGGFYPENMLVERRPWTRSLRALLKRHLERVEAVGEELQVWDSSPEDDLNMQQGELERVNISLGFLLPAAMREEHGRISREGRYRVWKELWFLRYFGRARSY